MCEEVKYDVCVSPHYAWAIPLITAQAVSWSLRTVTGGVVASRFGSLRWRSTRVMIMMTSSNGNIFRVTGPLCGELTGHFFISPHKGQWREALMFSLICAWINSWVNNGEAGDLRRHCAHYDVIVMHLLYFSVHASLNSTKVVWFVWRQNIQRSGVDMLKWCVRIMGHFRFDYLRIHKTFFQFYVISY